MHQSQIIWSEATHNSAFRIPHSALKNARCAIGYSGQFFVIQRILSKASTTAWAMISCPAGVG